jgi:hypothetical protein
LLSRRDRPPDHELKPERISSLFVAGNVVPLNAGANVVASGMEDFQRDEIVIATGQPMLKLALLFLGQAWPRRVPFTELLDKARERALGSVSSLQAVPEDPKTSTPDNSDAVEGSTLKRGHQTLESDRRNLAEFLLRCYAIGVVDLHSYPSTFVTQISDRPIASPLARWQVRHGQSVTSLRHQPLKIEDALGRELLQLLDGTRDRAALVEELSKGVAAGSTPIYCDGNLASDPEKALKLLATQLETSLASLARLGLLVG